ASAGVFFSKIRDLRDSIVHLGRSFEMVYLGEYGPAIHRTTQILDLLGVSAEPVEGNSNLLALWPLVAHVIFGTLTSCDKIFDALAGDVHSPPPLAPEYSVFLRGSHNESLIRLRNRHSSNL